jgi:phosphatidylethanolamine-binding protein (PEBP) family uncharacterized protein
MVAASGQKEQVSQELNSQYSTLETQILEIFSEYDFTSLSDDDIFSIHEAFREQGIKGGPELDEAIEAIGYDPEVLNNHLPLLPPGGNMEGRNEGGDMKEGPSEEKPVKIYEALSADYGPSNFTLLSSAVENGELLKEFQCEEKIDGIQKSIPLNWENVPSGTKSLAIIMYHFPHAGDETFANSYLLLWGIDPSVTEIPYGEAISGEWFMGSDKDGDVISYTSPCSAGPGTHEYHIAIFALSGYPEDLPKESTIDVDYSTFMDSIDVDNIIGKAELSFNVTKGN